jgi:hypothetical protein
MRLCRVPGAATPLPPANLIWAGEISAALDMVSAICPNCHLLLVEADTAGLVNVGSAVNEAVSMGANVITTTVAEAETSADTGRNLKKIQYHPHLIDGCLAETGLIKAAR